MWHSPYPLDPKRHKRVADVFEEFIVHLMYEKVEFKLRNDHFCFFGQGTKALSVRYTWLDDYDRAFISNQIYAHRETLFKENVLHDTGYFNLEGFIYNPKNVLVPVSRHRDTSESHTGICSYVWQRELMRDFAWLVMSKYVHLSCELLIALQKLMVDHPLGKKDIFLATLHSGVQGTINIYRVPCWGLSDADVHPEDAFQKREFKECTIEILNFQ